MEDRYVSRAAYGEAGASQDPFGFHQKGSGDQGSGTGTDSSPNWDPYNFHNQPGNKPGDTVKPWKDSNLNPPRTDVPLPPMPENKARELRLQDGAVNRFDEQGRCTLTTSADGRKSREVRYNDQADPNRVTQVVIDQSRVYTRNADGRTWDYQINGQPAGTWHGDVRMSKNGEYSFEDYKTGEKRNFAPNTADITPPGQKINRPECEPGTDCNPQGRVNYRPAQTQFCQPGQPCQPYYRPSDNQNYRPAAVQYDQYGQPIQGTRGGGCYPQERSQNCYPQQQQRYNDGGCGTNYRSYNNGGGDFGRAVVSSMVGSMMYRGYGGGYGGYGGYGRGYGGYGGGNIGGAIVGSLIGRAIRGGGRGGCR